MPKPENTAASTKNSKGAGRGSVPNTLNAIHSFIAQFPPPERCETLTEFFVRGVIGEAFNSAEKRDFAGVLYLDSLKMFTHMDKCFTIKPDENSIEYGISTIKMYLNIADGETRRELIEELFFGYIENETSCCEIDRYNTSHFYKGWISLDKAIEALYGEEFAL